MKRTVLTLGTVAVVTLGSTFFANSTSVHAQPSIDEISQKQDELKSKLSKAESEIADILYEIKDINKEIVLLDGALKENQKQIDKNEDEMNVLQEDIDELNKKIEIRNDILKSRISAYQENGGNIQYLEVFLGARDFSEFISRLSAVTTISNADRDLIEENEQDKEAVEVKLDEQKEVAAELDEQKETIKVQKEQKKESKKELKVKEEKLQSEKSELEGESSELQSLETEIRASIASPQPQVASATTENSSSNSSKSKSKAVNVAYTGGGTSAISAGYSVTGTPYVWAGSSPGGFDCSGFVKWAYAKEGVSLPRTASAMASSGSKVPYSQAKPGDLVIFRGGSHVGIYLGGGKFIGAQNSTGVAVADMNSGYWAQNFDGNVRRIK